jgi:peptidyl-prolyl cis-trans isomerase C
MKRFASIFLAGVTAVALCAQSGLAADSLFADKVLAKGKGVEVKQSTVDDALIALRASLASQNQVLPEAERPQIVTNLVERMVMAQLLLARANAEEKAEAKKLAEKFVEETKKRMPSEDAFKRRLDATGMKYETFLARAEEEALLRKVVEREVAGKITISDDAAKKYYDENPKQFDQPEMARASHIMLMTLDAATRTELTEEKKKEKRAKIDQLLVRAKAGEDFAALAKEFSEDKGSKQNGGEYTFARGRSGIPEFEAAAFALMPGQISDVVTSQYGYHIVKLLEKLPPKKLQLAEVSARIKDVLLAQETQRQMPDYYKKLKEEAGVQFFFEEKK